MQLLQDCSLLSGYLYSIRYTNVDSSSIESHHGVRETLVSNQLALVDFAVIKVHNSCWRSLPAHLPVIIALFLYLFLRFAEAKAWSSLIDEDCGDFLFSSPAHKDIQVAQSSSADEALGAVDDIVVPLEFGIGKHSLGITSASWFGEQEGSKLVHRDQIGHILVLELFGSEAELETNKDNYLSTIQVHML